MVIDPNFGAFKPFLEDLKNSESEASKIRDALAKKKKDTIYTKNTYLKAKIARQQKLIEALEDWLFDLDVPKSNTPHKVIRSRARLAELEDNNG